MESAPERDYWPTTDCQSAEPEDVSADADRLSELDAYARQSMPPIRGILIVRGGRVVFERYYDGCTEETYHTVNSVTKSVTSALIGIAFRKGLLTSVDQPVLDFFPELAAQDDPRKQAITLRHLLTMTSGFEAPGPGTPLASRIPLDSPNLVEAAFARPLATAPGAAFLYDELSCHLLSILLTRLTGLSAAAFAEQELFTPLGIWRSNHVRNVWKQDRGQRDAFHSYGFWPDDGRPWKVDQHGHTFGGGGPHLTLREMAKFGDLYLNAGRWDGVEAVPSWFVDDSTREQSAGGPPVNWPYGYLWWMRPAGGFFASGYGGQAIHVIADIDTIVAFATTQTRNWPAAIIGRFVVPAMSS